MIASPPVSLIAQATRGAASKEPGTLIHSPLPPIPDDRVKGPDSSASAGSNPDDESCYMWPLTGIRSSLAGVVSFQVPGQARKDFQHACRAVSDKRMTQAEQLLRKALHEDPQYPAAWVLLGQVSKAQQKLEDGRSACFQALKVDPNDIAAHLCLADLSAIEQKWGEMLGFAKAAIALDPVNDPHAYFYAGGAYLGLRRLPEAEKSALKAAEIDKTNREPRAHFLLAQIYELERKPDAEAIQLQEYLKTATNPQEVALVKKYLAELRKNGSK